MLKVIDKRDTPDYSSIRRRRQCLKCEKRFTTYERIEAVEIDVIKKDGKKESFSREKLKAGILTACEKRPVSLEQIDNIVSKIEADIRKKGLNEISSKKIGQAVIRHLKKIDKVAYLRFASVYKDFDGLDEFRDEIEKIDRKKEQSRKF